MDMDDRRIDRILRNLILNALEHGEGRPVNISVAANDNAVAVAVRDHGIGMTPAEAARVFDRFWRADPARARTTGGSGLGLSIAAEDTKLHNGWLQAWGRKGSGANFRLTLPLRQGETITKSPLQLEPVDVGLHGAGANGPCCCWTTRRPRAPTCRQAGTGTRPPEQRVPAQREPERRRGHERCHREGHPAAAALLAVLLFLLTSCAQIPRSGPVGKSTDESAGNPNNAPVFFPSAPRAGAGPEAVIEDFYLAGSGYEDDYAVARQYLTQASSVTWKPDQRVLVFRSARVVPTGVENVFNYELDVSYSVDADGVATQLPEGTKENIPATLTQVDGEWRIAELPDGTAIPEETFKVIYGAYPIYFYDPTFTYAVPDVRWFIKKKTVKAMTSALLGGPAPYLKGAVVSAFPSGIKLARESVPVVSGAAQVDLTAKDLVEASNEDRLRMQTQLALTFRSQPDVINVELRANQDLVRVEDNGSVLPPIRDKNVPARQIAVSNNDLVRYENNRISPLPDIQSVSSLSPRAPAESPVSQSAAFLNAGRGTLYSVVPGQPARSLTTRATLTRPSFDRYDWVWTAGPGANGATELVAYRPAGVAEGATVPTVTVSPAGFPDGPSRNSRSHARAPAPSSSRSRTAKPRSR